MKVISSRPTESQMATDDLRPNDELMITEIDCGGVGALKKLEKITTADIGRTENWWFTYVLKHIVKKWENNLEKIGKKVLKKLKKSLEKDFRSVCVWLAHF